MLELKHVHILQDKDLKVLLEDLCLTVNPGEKAAIIGEEGNGKSTLLKWIYDPSLVEGYAEVTGERRLKGRAGYLPQELPETDRNKSVYAYMQESCSIDTLSPKELIRTARLLGLDTALFYSDRFMGTLSGGERVKLQLGTLLLQDCDILLLDEPGNDLDLPTLDWLESFLRQTKKTVLYISHDETLLRRTAQCIVHLEQVRRKTIPRCTVAKMPYDTYMERRSGQMEQQRREARFERAAFEKKKERYLSISNAVEHAQDTISRGDPSGGRLLKKKMHAVRSLGRRLDKEEESLTQLPEAEWAILPKWEPGMDFPAGKVALDFFLPELQAGDILLAQNIRLKMTGPEHVALVGPNGCGKSTLLHQIWDFLRQRKDIRPFYMPQNYGELLHLQERPQDFLCPDGDKEAVTRARTYLGSMKYTTEEMEHPVSQLSGGQKAKLLLLKMILERANMLVLDEPTRNFSPLSAPAVRTLLRDFPGCILSVSHDRLYLQESVDTVYRLTKDGLVPAENAIV